MMSFVLMADSGRRSRATSLRQNHHRRQPGHGAGLNIEPLSGLHPSGVFDLVNFVRPIQPKLRAS